MRFSSLGILTLVILTAGACSKNNDQRTPQLTPYQKAMLAERAKEQERLEKEQAEVAEKEKQQEILSAEQSALPPVISYPANGLTIGGQTEVRVNLDESIDYQTVSLLINGEAVNTDSEAPFEFTWTPYFEPDETQASIAVVAVTHLGRELTSAPVLTHLNHALNSEFFTLLSPENTSPLEHDTQELDIHWSTTIANDGYQYQVGSNEPVSTAETFATIGLGSGSNVFKVRARSGEKWGGWVTLKDFEVYTPSAPSIVNTTPANNNTHQFEVMLDPALEYTQVSLVVGGTSLATKTEPPYDFELNPHFWQGQGQVDWWVEVTKADGTVINSSSQTVQSATAETVQSIDLSLPSGGPNYLNIEALDVGWTAISGASEYEYTLNGETDFTSNAHARLTQLQPGIYQLKVRAIDASGLKGPWSEEARFEVTTPSAPTITSPLNATELNSVDNVTVSWADVNGAAGFEYKFNGSEWQSINTTSLSLPVIEPSDFQLEIRSLDDFGRAGSSSKIDFSARPTNAPKVVSTTPSHQYAKSISVELDPFAEFSRVSLVVGGEAVSSLGANPPHIFEWNPYFWSDSATVSWWVEATRVDGQVLKSNIETIDFIEDGANTAIDIKRPFEGSQHYGADSVEAAWAVIPGASSYEYALNDTVYGEVSGTSALIAGLEAGNYQLKVRGLDYFGRKGSWSTPVNFGIALPLAPNFSYPTQGSEIASVPFVEVQWDSVKGAEHYEYRTQAGTPWRFTPNTSLFIEVDDAEAHFVEVRAVDRFGRAGETSTIEFSARPTNPPEVTVTNPSAPYSLSFDVDLDETAQYKSVSLIVNGELVSTSTEAPYSFEWQPYFWLDGNWLEWKVIAERSDGTIISSEHAVIENASASFGQDLSVNLPGGNSVFQGVNQLEVSWNAIPGANSYEYSFNAVTYSSAGTSVMLDGLGLGSHSVRARALNAQGQPGPWGPYSNFWIEAPARPIITSPQNYSSVSDVISFNVVWEASQGAANYEYRIQYGEWQTTTSNAIDVPVTEPQTYIVEVRALDELGNPGASSTVNFTVTAPAAPALTLEDKLDNNQLTLNASWSPSEYTVLVELANDTGFQNLINSEQYTNESSASFELAAGTFHLRAKAINGLQHESNWSYYYDINVGLFFTSQDIATFGWDTDDRPVDLLIDGDAITVLSARGDQSDGSGDDFNVAGLTRQGDFTWNSSFGSIATNPRTLSKTEEGFLVTGAGKDWRDNVFIELDKDGTYLWHKTLFAQEPTDDTRLEDRIQAAVQTDTDQYAYASTFYEWALESGNSSSITNREQRVTIYNKTSDETQVIVIPQPEEGEFTNISQLLVDEEQIYAAGQYKIDNGGDASDDIFVPTPTRNGAFLATLKTDGTNLDVRTGVGLSNASLNNIHKNGDSVVVSYYNYENCGATQFNSDGSSYAMLLPTISNCFAVITNKQNVLIVGKGGDSRTAGEPIVVVLYEAGSEVRRSELRNLPYNLNLENIEYHPDFGAVVLGRRQFGSNYDDTDTVIFNISDNLEYTGP